MRGGHDARTHYLEYDFLSRARITKLAVKAKWSRCVDLFHKHNCNHNQHLLRCK